MTNQSGVITQEQAVDLILESETEATAEIDEEQPEQEAETDTEESEVTVETEESTETGTDTEESNDFILELGDDTLTITETEALSLAELAKEVREDGGSLSDLKGERLRAKDYTQKTQQLSDERKQLMQDFSAQLQAVTERLGFAEQVVIGDLNQFKDVNWDKLRKEDENEFNERFPRYLEIAQKANELQAKIQQHVEQTKAIDQKALEETMQEQFVLAKGVMPELADQAKAKSFATDVQEYLTQLGFSNEEMKILDHRQFLILRDAMQGAGFIKDKAKIKQKIKKAPKVVRRAGHPVTTAKKVAKSEKAKREKLQKSGTLQDATELLLSHY